MKKLGLQVTGRWGTVSRFKDQLKRLFAAQISFTYEDKKGAVGQGKHEHVDKASIWNPEHPDRIDLFKSQILLGEIFYEEIKKSPIPVDIRAINGLKDSSLALTSTFG